MPLDDWSPALPYGLEPDEPSREAPGALVAPGPPMVDSADPLWMCAPTRDANSDGLRYWTVLLTALPLWPTAMLITPSWL